MLDVPHEAKVSFKVYSWKVIEKNEIPVIFRFLSFQAALAALLCVCVWVQLAYSNAFCRFQLDSIYGPISLVQIVLTGFFL